ncbi:hypothetical protein OPQ81_006430 [Rhizoctonia solani]|nr:hypothetical protein OPQ81_006430 [Rhizoctonia solani]
MHIVRGIAYLYNPGSVSSIVSLEHWYITVFALHQSYDAPSAVSTTPASEWTCVAHHASTTETVTYQPSVSSPLSAFTRHESVLPGAVAQHQPRRGPAFPTSRPLRPFASMNTSVMANGKPKPTVKMIEPKDTGRQFFVLGLSQSELARR